MTSYTGNGVKKNYYNQISEYRYKKNYYTVGEFSLTISASDPGEPYLIAPGDILYVYDPECVNDSLYVTTTECVRGRYIISGFDLKIILNWRITLFPTKEIEAGTYGYDCRQGYTGSIIKGYIDYNLCEASDPNRRIPGCWCAVDTGIGIENDTYMSRLQPLNEVVEALCANSGLGYDVFFDYLSNANIGINVYEGTDRRFGGIAFGAYIGNSDGIKLIRDNTAERSVVWAVNGIGVKDCTVTAVDLSGFSSAGIERKEAVVTTNCSAADVKIYAKKAAEDYTATEEIDASADGSGYGELFNVGDVVRVFDDGGGMSEMRIISVEKQYDGHSRRIKLSFADYFKPKPRKKVVNKLSTANTENKKDIIDQKIDTESGGGGDEDNGLTINQAVIVKEADAKYILHDFTETEYIAGNKIGYAGPGNQIIIQRYFAYSDAFFRETATSSTTAQYVYPIGWEKPFSTYAELSGTFFQSTNEYTKLYLELQEAQPLFSRYFYKGVKGDGTVVTMQSFNIDNYNLWSGVGLAVRWTNIFPPGATFQNRTFEYGVIMGIVLCVYQTASNITARIFNNSLYVPFASLAEYQAAVGLTYEPLTLTQVEDNPVVVSGKEVT